MAVGLCLTAKQEFADLLPAVSHERSRRIEMGRLAPAVSLAHLLGPAFGQGYGGVRGV